jgi:hypothetical protein
MNEQEATTERSGRNWWKIGGIGCMAIFGTGGLLVVAIIVVAALSMGSGSSDGGGGSKSPSLSAPDSAKSPDKADHARIYKVGQTAKVASVEWKVTNAYRTNQLTSSFGTQKKGDFVVDFTFTNHRSEEVTLDPDLHMILKDSKGQTYGSDVDAYEFVPTDLDVFLTPVNPGVSQDGRVIYQVSPEANGFTLKLDDVEMAADESATYDLGNIPQQTYSSGSASATASATASAGAQ